MTFNEWLQEWKEKHPQWAGFISCHQAEYEEPGDSWTYRTWPILAVGEEQFTEDEAKDLIEVLEKFLELPVNY